MGTAVRGTHCQHNGVTGITRKRNRYLQVQRQHGRQVGTDAKVFFNLTLSNQRAHAYLRA